MSKYDKKDLELLDGTDRKEIEDGSALEDLSLHNGAWVLIKEYLDGRRTDVADVSFIDITKTPEEVKADVIERVAIIRICDDIDNFIKDKVDRKNVLADALLPDDNEGVI